VHTGRLIFAQLMDFLPLAAFRRSVARYQGDYKVRGFSCLDQFLCLAFAQLTYRESLRDIETCLRAMQPKLYHMGIRGRVARSTLADANETRDWHIYADFAQLYKARWQVELFFKWIKQHLRIKAFYGTSANAVKTQVWVAISVYVLVAIVKKRLGLPQSLYTILQVLSVTLFENTSGFIPWQT
jgi:IS4 transposase